MVVRTKGKRFQDILIEKEFFSREDVHQFEEQARKAEISLAEYLLMQGKISEEETARIYSEQFSIEYIDLNKFDFQKELFEEIPIDYMFKYNFVPLALRGNTIHIAVSNPMEIILFDELETLLDKKIKIYVTTKASISQTLKKSEGSQRHLEKMSEEFKNRGEDQELLADEIISIEKISDSSKDIIKLVDSVIFNSIQRRASDIHFESTEIGMMIKYRIDGVLVRATDPLGIKFMNPIISRIKIMSELDISERNIPQDGRFKRRLSNKAIDFRVSILPSVYGEDCVIRILDKEAISAEFTELTLEVLGIESEEILKIQRHIKEPHGMILVTGPTGSGKTTTLYAALHEIRTTEDKIITIEDPVEYHLNGVTQVPINEKKGLTFAKGLRSILRHDPDKIMVGEIRDQETAEIAVQAALTGHLVLTTVHANTAVDVIGRFLNMKVETYNFVSALSCIISQRLIRKICPACKAIDQNINEYIEKMGYPPERYRDFTHYKGRGCFDCHGTGFLGREAVLEIITVNDVIRKLILDRRSASEIKTQAKNQGTRFLREVMEEKLRKGVTTLKEIDRVSFISSEI